MPQYKLPETISCTLRSGQHKIPTMIRTFPHGLDNNHTCKLIYDNFRGMTYICKHSWKVIRNPFACLVILQSMGKGLFSSLKYGTELSSGLDTFKDLLPSIRKQQSIQMDFWQFSRNADICVIPGKLSEIHLHAWVFSHPRGKVLISAPSRID